MKATDTMARPRKDPTEALTEWVRSRVTVEDKQRIEDNAAKAGLSVSEFVRRASLGAKFNTASKDLGASRMDVQTMAELNAIGVNINQYARAANAGRDMPQSIEHTLHLLYQTIEKVSRRFDT